MLTLLVYKINFLPFIFIKGDSDGSDSDSDSEDATSDVKSKQRCMISFFCAQVHKTPSAITFDARVDTKVDATVDATVYATVGVSVDATADATTVPVTHNDAIADTTTVPGTLFHEQQSMRNIAHNSYELIA